VTAGPTHEPLDAVRYLANRSSGRMGLALAEAAAARGWPVTLLLGPTWLSPPQNPQIHTIRFQTTADLQRELKAAWPAHDVLLMAAAVADFRPARPDLQAKRRRADRPLRLEFEPTPDLLAEAIQSRRIGQIVIGFALEPPTEMLASAWEKLSRKNADAFIANPLKTMDSERVDAVLLLKSGRTLRPPQDCSKIDFAAWLLDQIDEIAAALMEGC
jgi:phosphopantothenoylcysteine decarboxylase/phosphopantothenate--cysteine ligase